MTMTTDTEAPLDGTMRYEPETPFAESSPAAEAGEGFAGFTPWTESFSPFAETGIGGGVATSEYEAAAAEAFAALRDEDFDEALAELVSETAEVVDHRLAGEAPGSLGGERERLGDAHLAPVTFEAEQYLDRLNEGLAGLDLASFSDQQLDEVLDRFDAAGAGLSPAGEEFIGKLIRKAKSVVRTVVRTAGKIAKAALPFLGPILNRLKALVRPLLKRVLAIAIGRLPTALQAPARMLATRLGLGEAELGEEEAEGPTVGEAATGTPVAIGNPESLGESFDAALAEAIAQGPSLAESGESFGYEGEAGGPVAEAHLEALAAAREALTGQFSSAGDGEDMAPAIEQFIPAILPALRLGIRLVGRPRVVSFLAKFLAGLVRQWVGPTLAGPLSSAIVDIGLRMLTLEEPESGEAERPAAPAVLAATIEDTVRALAEQEDYVFEDEDLMQLAVAEAFEQSVAANFPTQFVRPDLRIAPSLGGSFVPRRFGREHSYKKYSRVPEIEITLPLAQAVTTFGAATLAASLAASGWKPPFRARVHIYEGTLGTSIPRMTRLERVRGLGSSRRAAWGQVHPLTPRAAGLLLREPRLGVRVPNAFLRSPHRIAAGQRFYYLEPLEAAGAAAALPASAPGRCTSPSRSRVTIDLRTSEIVIAHYFAEADAQALAASIRRGQSPAPLLRALVEASDRLRASFVRPDGRIRIVKEQTEAEEFLGPLTSRVAPALMAGLQRKLRGWSARAVAAWARTGGQEFVRATDDARCGVTVLVTLRAVPGLAAVRQAIDGQLRPSSIGSRPGGGMFDGSPTVAVVARPGRHRR